MRRPPDPPANGVVDPRMFPPDPEVVRRATEQLAALRSELATADRWRDRRRIRHDIRRVKAEAAGGSEPHRGAIY
jgi:hypothetical protein